jgi:hypothetical protein
MLVGGLAHEEVTEELNYEPIHFVLTSTWLVMGGLFQTCVVLRNIQNQVTFRIRQTLNG